MSCRAEYHTALQPVRRVRMCMRRLHAHGPRAAGAARACLELGSDVRTPAHNRRAHLAVAWPAHRETLASLSCVAAAALGCRFAAEAAAIPRVVGAVRQRSAAQCSTHSVRRSVRLGKQSCKAPAHCARTRGTVCSRACACRRVCVRMCARVCVRVHARACVCTRVRGRAYASGEGAGAGEWRTEHGEVAGVHCPLERH